MKQVHAYYTGSSYVKRVPAREIMEWSLIEEFHWTPQQISEIPYKKLQRLLAVKNQKNATAESKINVEKFKQEYGKMTRSGQVKRYIREV